MSIKIQLILLIILLITPYCYSNENNNKIDKNEEMNHILPQYLQDKINDDSDLDTTTKTRTVEPKGRKIVIPKVLPKALSSQNAQRDRILAIKIGPSDSEIEQEQLRKKAACEANNRKMWEQRQQREDSMQQEIRQWKEQNNQQTYGYQF